MTLRPSVVALLPLPVEALRVKVVCAVPRRGYLYVQGHFPRRVVEFVFGRRGFQCWMALPFVDERFHELELAATRAGYGEVAPVEVLIMTLLNEQCRCCGRPAVKEGYCGRCGGELSSAGRCVLCQVKKGA